MMPDSHKQLSRLILMPLITLIAAACAGGPENNPDLPPAIQRCIPYLSGLSADGLTGDWTEAYVPISIQADVCGNIPDSKDFQTLFRVAWNEGGIFILAEIRDDSLYEDPHDFWKGDGLELFLSHGRGSRDILQVSVIPGFDGPDSMAPCKAYDHLRSRSISTTDSGILFSSRRTRLGYLLEGIIPFETFSLEPGMGRIMAMQLYLNDADRENDPDNFSLPWYPVRESYMNPYAFQAVMLTADQYPGTMPELRACIVDEEMIRLKVIRDQSHDRPLLLIKPGSFRQRIHRNTLIKEWRLPADKLLSGDDTRVGLLFDDHPLQVLDLDMAQHVYENTDPPEWYENEIRIFEFMDRYDPPPDSAALFTGSSTIRRWYSLQEDIQPMEVINRGFGGSVMSELNLNMDRIVIPYKPSRIFVYEGDNDIARGTSPEAFLKECKAFINRCLQELPGTEIYFLSIKPSPSRMSHWKKMDRANQLLETLCSLYDHVHFIDISTPMFTASGMLKNDIYAEDRLHLNDKGYSLLREVVRENIVHLVK
jgi:lysophospholipase L1-like esterase